MNSRFKLFGIIIFSFLISFTLIGCDSGSDSGSGSSSADGFAIGRVDFAAVVMNKTAERTILAKLKNFFSLTETANAQGGITVNVIQDGAVVETTVTDSEGNFTIATTGDITLEFVTSEGTFSTDLTLPDNNVTTISVTLDTSDMSVSIDDISPGIDCEEGGMINIAMDVIINGQGETCIETEGNCSVNLTGSSVILQNCDSCIEAEDSSSVIITGEEFSCDSSEDGIEAEDDAVIDISSQVLSINSGEDDIDSEDDTTIVISSDDCSIDGDVVEFDDSSIELNDDCESTDILDGEEEGGDDGNEDDADDDDDDNNDDNDDDADDDDDDNNDDTAMI